MVSFTAAQLSSSCQVREIFRAASVYAGKAKVQVTSAGQRGRYRTRGLHRALPHGWPAGSEEFGGRVSSDTAGRVVVRPFPSRPLSPDSLRLSPRDSRGASCSAVADTRGQSPSSPSCGSGDPDEVSCSGVCILPLSYVSGPEGQSLRVIKQLKFSGLAQGGGPGFAPTGTGGASPAAPCSVWARGKSTGGTAQ